MTGTGFAAPSGNALARGAARVIGGVMGKPIGKQSTSAKSRADLAALVTDPACNDMTGKYFDRGVETQPAVRGQVHQGADLHRSRQVHGRYTKGPSQGLSCPA